MAKAFPPAQMPVQPGDIDLTDEELHEISFVARLARDRKEKLLKFPGAMRLRRVLKGQAICRQGEPGSSAFYILRGEDWLRVLSILRREEDPEREPAARQVEALMGELDTDRRERLERAFEAVQVLEDRRQQVQARIDGRAGAEAQLKKLSQEAEKAGNKEKAATLKGLMTAPAEKKRQHALAIKDSDPELAKLLFSHALSPEDLKKFQQDEEFFRTADAGEKRIRAKEMEAKDPKLGAMLRLSADVEETLPAFAHVFLTTGKDRARPTGFFAGIKNWFLPKRDAKEEGPSSLPSDAPSELDFRTRRANLFEGDLFGEMACLTRQARSATVTAARDGFLLEILGNVLEEIDKDPDYKKERERLYRRRVLQLHLRELGLFKDLPTKDYTRVLELIRDKVELVTFTSGQVICDEHERSDCIYLVREGMVQVIKNISALLRPTDVKHWAKLTEKVKGAAGPAGALVKQLPAPLSKALGEAGATPAEALKAEALLALNELIKSPKVLTLPEMKPILEGDKFKQRAFYLPADRKGWSETQVRRANRLLLEEAFPEAFEPLPPPAATADRILTYLSRGDIFGEIGVVENIPRTATCVAYSQPRLHSDQKDLGRVELVRIGQEMVRDLMERYPVVREGLKKVIEGRQRKSEEELKKKPAGPGLEPMGKETAEAARLGLVQGQRLMLIDLERCTRCDECVKACVDSHDDGRTRLFLTGPRFGKYLVPFTCRSCLDPVCMIGCPVRSIQRGENLEIQIKDWCIGCGICARQCPYNSIQIHPLNEGEGSAEAGVELRGRAAVCDMCSSLADQEPRCVYACPHEAAMRVDFRKDFADLKP